MARNDQDPHHNMTPDYQQPSPATGSGAVFFAAVMGILVGFLLAGVFGCFFFGNASLMTFGGVAVAASLAVLWRFMPVRIFVAFSVISLGTALLLLGMCAKISGGS